MPAKARTSLGSGRSSRGKSSERSVGEASSWPELHIELYWHAAVLHSAAKSAPLSQEGIAMETRGPAVAVDIAGQCPSFRRKGAI